MCMGVTVPSSVSACVLLGKLPDQATCYRKGAGSEQPPPLFREDTRPTAEDSSVGDLKTGPGTQ